MPQSHAHGFGGSSAGGRRFHSHFFTVLDCSTHWPAAFPVWETSAKDCIAAFTKWNSSFGVPATLTSDRGAQFTPSAWTAFCKSLRVDLVTITAYYPQANGMVEHMHRRLKTALVARKSSASFPWVLLGLRSVPLEALGVFSVKMVFGSLTSLCSHFLSAMEIQPDQFLDSLHRLMDLFQPPPLFHGSSLPSSKVHLPPALWEAKFVFVRHDGPSRLSLHCTTS